MVSEMDLVMDNAEPYIIQENGKRRSDAELSPLSTSSTAKRQKTSSATSKPSHVRNLVNNDDLPDLVEERPAAFVVVKYRRVLRHIPMDIPYMPIQTDSGSRVYLRILQKDKKLGGRDDFDGDDDREKDKVAAGKISSHRTLIADWDRVKAEARILKDKFHRTLAKVIDNENVEQGLGVVRKFESPAEQSESDSLWVEKYKPRSYLDLLSEESVNRTMLHWLKLWDKTVFGSDYLSKVKLTKEKYSKLDAKEKEIKEKNKRFQFQARQAVEVEEDYDESGRPKMKVALLHGPPGLGKTTCAHVVGRHAGYNIREMNASDDRSVEIFRKVIDDVTQSKSEIFQDGRPNCLVIDEIDGAPAATVNVLIDLITGNATETGKKKTKKVLRRPIICICNDLYAPSLKLLKKHALVLQFQPLTSALLSERLQEISNKENLSLDNGTIQSLAEKTDCDIRSCLSTMQFLKKKNCTPKDALFSQIGMKDKSKGVFAVWSDIFSISEGKKYFDTEDPSKPDARFRSVLRVVQSFGEYEKLQGGVFENYLRTKFKDCYFESVLEGLSWTTWFEDLRMSIDRQQNYILMGYLPVYFVANHFLFAQKGWLKINFPSNDIYTRTQRYQTILKSQLSDMSPSVGRYLDPHGMVTDLFPSLMSIIQPTTIRPVPTQIWSARERETLKNVVEVMIAYNLSYNQMKNPETGAYNFVLDPDIEEIVRFKFQEQTASKKSFPYAVKQLVAREIETEKMRLSDYISTNTDSTVAAEKKKDSSDLFKLPKPVEKKSPVVTTLTPKLPKDLTLAGAKDFFGRSIAPTAESTQEMLAQQRRSSGIYYRFKEGYSNAVRRHVKMKDLM